MTDQAYPPQQPGYPPQQPGYPQEQPGYPPQQPGYPPQQAGYPPQQQGYPPQQQGYPPEQQGYPPEQQGYPPEQTGYPPQQTGYQQPGYPQPEKQGYAAPPPYAQQGHSVSSTSNVVVVQQQPVATTTTVYTRRYGTGDHGLVYAIIASCIVFWCFGWPGLFCTIPAIFLSINAQSYEQSGNLDAMRTQQNLSVGLSTAGLITGFVCLLLYIILGSAR